MQADQPSSVPFALMMARPLRSLLPILEKPPDSDPGGEGVPCAIQGFENRQGIDGAVCIGIPGRYCAKGVKRGQPVSCFPVHEGETAARDHRVAERCQSEHRVVCAGIPVGVQCARGENVGEVLAVNPSDCCKVTPNVPTARAVRDSGIPRPQWGEIADPAQPYCYPALRRRRCWFASR